MKRLLLLLALIAAAAFVAGYWGSSPAPASPYPDHTGICSYDPATSTVTGVNLPTTLDHSVYGTTAAVINFRREDAADNLLEQYVLGTTDTGTITVAVPAPSSPYEIYEFISQTWGGGGSQYSVYAECTSLDT